jgi:hypothetical protein
MSQTLLPLAGFEVTLNGRFWVTAEALEHSSVYVRIRPAIKSKNNARLLTEQCFVVKTVETLVDILHRFPMIPRRSNAS